jgi:hypothetical protein
MTQMTWEPQTSPLLRKCPWHLPIVSPQGPSLKTWIFVELYQIHCKHQI